MRSQLLIASILVGMGAAGAGAQNSNPHGGPLLYPPYRLPAAPQPGPGQQIRQRPPDLLTPNSSGLLEQQFQYMRSTSPNPDKFLYGRWNPRTELVNPPNYPTFNNTGGNWGGPWWGGGTTIITPGFTGVVNGGTVITPGGFGGGFVGGFGGLGGGFGGGFGFNPAQPVIRREVYVVPQQQQPQQPGGGAATPNPQPGDQTARPAPPSSRLGDAGGFYLGQRPDTIDAAVDDVRAAWMNGDLALLKSRLPKGEVRLYTDGKFRSAMAAESFGQLVRDAMAAIDTLQFELNRPTSNVSGRAFVTGRHVYLDADKKRQEVHISYEFERTGNRWLLRGTGSGSQPVQKHQD